MYIYSLALTCPLSCFDQCGAARSPIVFLYVGPLSRSFQRGSLKIAPIHTHTHTHTHYTQTPTPTHNTHTHKRHPTHIHTHTHTHTHHVRMSPCTIASENTTRIYVTHAHTHTHTSCREHLAFTSPLMNR